MPAIDILRRRRLVVQYWSQGITNAVTIKELLGQSPHDIDVSEETVRRDLRSMDKWLPELVELDKENKNLDRILSEKFIRVQLIQERMTQIAYSGDKSAAQVGAGLGALKAVREELDIRARMGQISPQTLRLQQEVEKPVITVEDLIGEYGDVILDEVMRRRLQGDRGEPEKGAGEPVDPPPPNP